MLLSNNIVSSQRRLLKLEAGADGACIGQVAKAMTLSSQIANQQSSCFKESWLPESRPHCLHEIIIWKQLHLGEDTAPSLLDVLAMAQSLPECESHASIGLQATAQLQDQRQLKTISRRLRFRKSLTETRASSVNLALLCTTEAMHFCARSCSLVMVISTCSRMAGHGTWTQR